MELALFSQDFFLWLLGILTTIMDFLVKSLANYLWLKAPQIAIRAMLKGTVTHPPQNGYRNYEYKIDIELQNHSKRSIRTGDY